MSKRPGTPARPAPLRRRRKTLDIDQALLDAAKAALGCATETGTVRTALERVITTERIVAGLDALGGTRGFDRTLIED